MIMGTAKDGDNDGNGTFMVSSLGTGADATTLVIRNVPLDVSGASGPVTAMVGVASSEDTDFVRFDGPNSGMVISDIVVGIDAEGDSGTLRTRGGEAMAELTLEEAFKGAFATPVDAQSEIVPLALEIEFSGIPDDATLTAELVGILIDTDEDPDTTAIELVEASADDPYATISTVGSDGKATLTLGGNDGDDERAGPDEVTLMLTLTAASNDKDITFPLDVGTVMAKATFTEDDRFEDAFTDYVTVFEIRPAQCEMLFPLVTYIQDDNGMPLFNTGFAIVNPAYESDAAGGAITFTFYKKDIRPVEYATSGGSPGSGLEDDGTLAPGSTYTVNANELLAEANWAELDGGHAHVLTDYTNCHGLGLIYGAMGIDQSYPAVVLDSDTGME